MDSIFETKRKEVPTMVTKIRILSKAEAPVLQIAETFKWLKRFVAQDPANVRLEKINQSPPTFRLVPRQGGRPVQISSWLREQLASIEVEIID